MILREKGYARGDLTALVHVYAEAFVCEYGDGLTSLAFGVGEHDAASDMWFYE